MTAQTRTLSSFCIRVYVDVQNYEVYYLYIEIHVFLGDKTDKVINFLFETYYWYNNQINQLLWGR